MEAGKHGGMGAIQNVSIIEVSVEQYNLKVVDFTIIYANSYSQL